MTDTRTSRITSLLAAIALSACATSSPPVATSSAPATNRQPDPAYVAQARADSIRHP